MNPDSTTESETGQAVVNPGISRRVGIGFGALAALLLAISFVRPFVWPAAGVELDDDVDVVFVTSDDDTERHLGEAAALVSRHPGSTLIALTASDGVCPSAAAECTTVTGRTDEARKIGELAEANGWDGVIVITERHRVHHTRQLLRSCGPSGKTLVVGVDSADSLLSNLSEIASDVTSGLAGSLRDHC